MGRKKGSKNGAYTLVTRNCEVCGKEFSAYPAQTKFRFCSKECYLTYHTYGKKIIRICPQCHNEFSLYKKDQRSRAEMSFCSWTCCNSYYLTNGWVEVHCWECNKSFYIRKYIIDNQGGKFCSQKCRGLYKTRISHETLICKVCGKPFIIPLAMKGKTECCSRKCGKTGSRNPQWTGGLSIIYGSKWCHNLRVQIRIRDNYTCAICLGEGLDVHHIDYDKNNNEPENLITLCHSCHSKTNTNRDKWLKLFTERNSNG